MHEIIPPLKKGIIRRAPSAKPLAKLGGSRHRLDYSKSEQSLNRGDFLRLPYQNAAYLKARASILERLNAKARATRSNPVWLSVGARFRNRSFGVERVWKSPKLRNNPNTYWVCFRPFTKKGALGGVEEGGRTGNTEEETDEGPAFPSHKMRSWVQFLTTPTADTPGTTLLLHFDNRRYLIGNVGEGTQRACVQRGIGLSRVDNIFLTGVVNWGTAGGLIGMILTLADVTAAQRAAPLVKKRRDEGPYIEDKPSLTLHGGKNLMHLLATSRRFVFRKGMPIDVDEIREEPPKDKSKKHDWTPTWSDQNIKVWAMTISPGVSTARQRKRSHEEMVEDSCTEMETSLDGKEETKQEHEDRNNQIRKGVVSHMFDSDWRLDALKAMKLSDVKASATIFVRNAAGKIEKYEGLLPGGTELVPDMDVLVRNPWPGAMIESLPPTTPSVDAMSYIIKNHPQRGKFDPDEATRLGVKKGPQFRQLTTGKSVTTDNGHIVTPDMVLAPGKQGGGFAIVELPSRAYIDNCVNREEWLSEEIMDGVGGIVWVLGKGVMADERLQNFMKRHSSLHHIVSSTDVCANNIALESPAEAAIKLHLLDPARFPVPVHNNVCGDMDLRGCEKARVGMLIQLEPTFEVQGDKVVQYLDTAQVIKNADEEVLKLAEEAREMVNDPTYQATIDELQKDLPGRDAEVITLGTGSALPSKYRNVSATLLRVPGHGNYLFDCGENTLGQLGRVFGAELPQILQDLKVIWISHLHADHHLGTTAVVRAWHDETKQHKDTKSKRLMIASDNGMLKWLAEYSEVEDFGFSRIHALPMHKSEDLQKQFTELETQEFGLSSIKACYVEHCHGALAVVFNFPNRLKVAYSGDCRPSHSFAQLGKGATLLIHEATFDDELAGDALAKKHSTTSEALGVGKEMGARRILLTHFSQRYQKIPVMDASEKDQVVIVAFDYMHCLLGDFAKLAAFRPALLKLYEEKEKDD